MTNQDLLLRYLPWHSLLFPIDWMFWLLHHSPMIVEESLGFTRYWQWRLSALQRLQEKSTSVWYDEIAATLAFLLHLELWWHCWRLKSVNFMLATCQSRHLLKEKRGLLSIKGGLQGSTYWKIPLGGGGYQLTSFGGKI